MDGLRSSIYGALELAFRRPSPAQVGVLADLGGGMLLQDLPGSVPLPLRSWPEELEGFCRDVQERGEESVARELLVEYSRLFLGPGPVPCPPYGSLYLDGEIMGPSTLEAARMYREEGLAVSGSWREPPDHVAVEMGFMAHLSSATETAARRGNTTEVRRLLVTQAVFLEKHLGRWGPRLTVRLAGAARGHLYRFLAAFVPLWLAFDGELLSARARNREVGVVCE